MSPVYDKKVYTTTEVKNLLKQAQCLEINIFRDHHQIIANLCHTVLEMANEQEKEGTMK
tara:strand:- start:220 stop:396 length:177 start_codon:yes stop_codon:yes gene_type:complete